jgi:deoxyribodipyrimidine photo-lyase
MTVTAVRVRAPHDLAVQTGRDLVVYWMIGARRTSHNAALDRALELCAELDKPLLVVEPLRAGYHWASERMHAFVIDGMRDNAAAFAQAGIAHHAYVEPHPGAGRGLLATVAQHAAVIVTDEALGFFQPRMIDAAARAIDTRLEVVDGNGILPVHSVAGAQPTAQAFRRHVQRTALVHLASVPSAAPLSTAKRARGAEVPPDIALRWPSTIPALESLPIDHTVRATLRGGEAQARATLDAFLAHGLARYADDRSHPDIAAQSSLSPWLHFGHIGAHEIFAAVARGQSWSPTRVNARVTGAKEGFWGMDRNAEAFIDELVTWRELAHNGAAFLQGFETFDATPAWARASLAAHESDPRAHLYTLDQLERADTHDDVWNAAQRQLVQTGVMHNALRMLWGKNVLAWSRSAREAFDVLVHLNNKYAIDGRDPNSYAGIGWVFGRYDRPWPERAVFGVVRCMTTASSRKKWHMDTYLDRFSGAAGAAGAAHRQGSLFARAPAHALTQR